MRKPALYIMCGLPFSGKTTFTKEIRNRFLFERVDIDEIKAEHGLGNKSDDDVTNEQWQEIFNDIDNRIKLLMRQKKGIISDISNLEKSDRDHLREIAAKFNYPTWVIYINTPAEVAKERWFKNKSYKERFDLTRKVFEAAVKSLEIPTEDENVIILDYKQPLEQWVRIFETS